MDPKPHLFSIFFRTFKLVLRVRAMFKGWKSCLFVNCRCVEFSCSWIRMHNIWCIIVPVLSSRSGRRWGFGQASAEGVKLLAKGSIPPLPCKEESIYGKVVRPLRSVNLSSPSFTTFLCPIFSFWLFLVWCRNGKLLFSFSKTIFLIRCLELSRYC